MKKVVFALGLLGAVALATPSYAHSDFSFAIGLPGFFGVFGRPLPPPPPPVVYAPPVYYPPVAYRPYYGYGGYGGYGYRYRGYDRGYDRGYGHRHGRYCHH